MAEMEPSDQDIQMVAEVTELRDRKMIVAALKMKNNDVNSVVMEYFEDADKFQERYKVEWDESVFNSNRDGEDNSSVHVTRSFTIYRGDDNPIYQGIEPNSNFYAAGAPSRPPSRANARSPITSLVDSSLPDYGPAMGAPTSQQQEEADFQRALVESMNTSGIQTPQPPPLPQDSGVIEMDTNMHEPYFGPANRPDYDSGEWAMVHLRQETNPDPEPLRRTRPPGAPAFLRCRVMSDYGKHRVGAMLTIFHTIPAARNVFLSLGSPPETGYGNNKDWWKGGVILPAEALQQETEASGWAQHVPRWSDELHRLMAFLDLTDRSYGTADMLFDAGTSDNLGAERRDKDFFEVLKNWEQDPATHALMVPFLCEAKVELISGEGEAYDNSWLVLPLAFKAEHLRKAETLNDVWDFIFYRDFSTPSELETAQVAFMTHCGDVLSIIFDGDDDLPITLDIPETFYVDRYLEFNREKMLQVARDMAAVDQALKKSEVMEQKLTRWVGEGSPKFYDRRDINAKAVEQCEAQIKQIKASASWRQHEEARAQGEDDHYIPDLLGEPNLSGQELHAVQELQVRIQQLRQEAETIDQIMQTTILPERAELHALFRRLSSLLTTPSEDPAWNPTHAYHLRGIVNEPSTVFVRVSPEPDLMDTEDVPRVADKWWKIQYLDEDEDPVRYQEVTYEQAVREACGVGTKPILIYATEKALEEEPLPLSDALRTFVKHDNRLFKLDRDQEPDRVRQTGQIKRISQDDASAPSKRFNRSNSIGSMDTNRASVGSDEDRDAAFENEDKSGAKRSQSNGSDLPDLIDTSVPASRENTNPFRRSTAQGPAGIAHSVDGGYETPAQLPDMDHAKPPEMQERSGMPFVTRPGNAVPSSTNPDEIRMSIEGSDQIN